jgi:monofunctional biosynthetic peptidoglycan transglycosylase
MQFLPIILFTMMITHDINLKYDFGSEQDGFNWNIVNDDVMGGISKSTIDLTENSAVFSGYTSLKNNGGFSSIRSPRAEKDLSMYDNVRIRFKSNTDREFALRLGLYDAYYKPNYKYFFKSETKDWQTIEFKLSEFKEYRLGILTDNSIQMELMGKVLRVGIIIADKKEGPFQIEIDYIEFF